MWYQGEKFRPFEEWQAFLRQALLDQQEAIAREFLEVVFELDISDREYSRVCSAITSKYLTK